MVEPRRSPHGASVAPAIPADFVAIRDVDVQRDPIRRLHGVQRVGEITGPDVVGELGRGGIAGVARHRPGREIGVENSHRRHASPGRLPGSPGAMVRLKHGGRSRGYRGKYVTGGQIGLQSSGAGASCGNDGGGVSLGDGGTASGVHGSGRGCASGRGGSSRGACGSMRSGLGSTGGRDTLSSWSDFPPLMDRPAPTRPSGLLRSRPPQRPSLIPPADPCTIPAWPEERRCGKAA